MMLGISMVFLIVSIWLVVKFFVEDYSLGSKVWGVFTVVLWIFNVLYELAKVAN
ncbi:hypothetical protein PQE68_gp152 [Bacillus phage vB_BanS_Sophrita]|uniref:Uncharacterized protein n=1 Tax=Bacillus phage vB_BanS_Sophrita TaxID=2894790 RepID=A0AAE8YTX5_9CAUD|nr:hypothetical protein PQE68_gp152 [Bacillus phage vB_BanS_Sophrita]UGO50743.1 hypothetical protein SOPHRITA_152 [Bacillus phage vB_BanS_Sophrita]